MNSERQDPIDRRAARHAALGDPARLRIVDLLTLGDLSPSEIRVALGMPANLVTHHLNTLEAVGMVSRSRSEADKRRSYVRLSPTALDGLIPGVVEHAERVVFVCTANSARSQLAAALWKQQSAIPAASGGTHPSPRIDDGAVAAAERHHLALTDARPRALSEIITPNDFVVTVCDNAHEELGVTGNLHWSIPDPVRIGTAAAFDTTYAELQRRISDLAPRLAAS
ncbi:ArsR family transcriptional regulator [Labedella phragmitis]|uniref:ArsR family transcriptional regulator n=1 Tax=Labedella phragmitis TaxID=2498849 RepID=A0A444PXB4_9MICO|nr:ArsR family transcriptional regulator [Labedella phragmitis]RWZ52451.1 ArsR family transcriptional regulator [Labedella phragmitis]